jgi:hypothetical protein
MEGEGEGEKGRTGEEEKGRKGEEVKGRRGEERGVRIKGPLPGGARGGFKEQG